MGAVDTDRLMPKYKDIPDEFRRGGAGANRWLNFQRDWFYGGVENLEATPKDGVDPTLAMRHLSAIQRSWQPKHQHKEAAVAYLASLWFDEIKWEMAARKEKKP